MPAPLYIPAVRYGETKDGSTRVSLYKVVRVSPNSRYPDLPTTTVSFDWQRYKKLEAKHGIKGKDFGKLVRAAYAELMAEGFRADRTKSQQLWWRIVRMVESGAVSC